jgi:hypothetical protein
MKRTDSQAAHGPRRLRGWLLRIGCGLVATALLFEGALRLFAYTDLAWGASLRVPQYYADRWSDPLYFQLAQRWNHEPGVLDEKVADARLGWVHGGMDRTTFIDPRESELGDRRALLLFGDSYIRCMTDDANCFEGWMERSPHAKTHAIFNYGVRGYGLDQICLLSELALEHWKGRRAIVAIGIFMEDDLDRAYLDHRGWPKPRFSLDANGALIDPAPIPSPEQYEREHPLWKRSLAWGWLVHGSGWLPPGIERSLSGSQHIQEDKQRLCGAILERLERSLQQGGFDHFYVLFPSVRECETLAPRDWQENFLIDWLDARRLPYVNVKREIYRAALAQDRHPTEFFGFQGPQNEHLTPEGNEVAFQGLLRGISGEFDRANGRPAPHASDLRDLDGPRSGRVRRETGWSERFPLAEDRERFILQPTVDHAARLGCELAMPARRFIAIAKYVAIAGQKAGGSLQLEIRVDERVVRELVLDPATNAAKLEIDLIGHAKIEIVATQVDARDPPAAVALLSSPRFE